MLVTNVVCFSQPGRQVFVVLAQFLQHVIGLNIRSIIIKHALQLRDLANLFDGRGTDLAHALGDRVGHAEDLVRLLVKQQVVVAEMRTA